MIKYRVALTIFVFSFLYHVHAENGADSSTVRYSDGRAQIAQQGCVEKQKQVDSVSKKAAEQEKLTLKRKDLEKKARELMDDLAIKESAFKKNEDSIMSWFENTDDTNVAKAVINALQGQDLNVSTSAACDGGTVKPGITVPWKSYCNLDSNGDYSSAARFWTGTNVHKDGGGIYPRICSKQEFVKPGRNQSDLGFYLLDTYTTHPKKKTTMKNREQLCSDGVKGYAQSLVEFENALAEFESVKFELMEVHQKLIELELSDAYLEDDNGCEMGSPQ